MKRLWIADDIHRRLLELQHGDESTSDTLRRVLEITKRKYTRSGKKSEAVRKGIAKAKRCGKIVGRPRYPEYARNNMRKLKQAGWSLAQIGLFWGASRSTVKRILRER